MPCPNQRLFESGEYLVQICDDHIFYAEKDNVLFDFRNITRLKVSRQKKSGKVSKITYRMKGQLSSFQIDGFTESEMEEIAGLLKSRAREHSIEFLDAGDGASAGPEES